MSKSLKRFFIAALTDTQIDLSSGEEHLLSVAEPETHYMQHVLRMKEGTSCIFFDQSGREFLAQLKRFCDNGTSEAILLEERSKAAQGRSVITVAQAIPQHRKMDDMVRTACEIGIDELVPLITERTVVRMSQEKQGQVLSRWNRIAEQTLQQSGVSRLVRIWQPTDFDSLLAQFENYDLIYLLDPDDHGLKAGDLFQTSDSAERVLVLIGPEGGFSEDEVKRCQAAGAKLVRLDTGILKTDTAFVLASGLICRSSNGILNCGTISSNACISW